MEARSRVSFLHHSGGLPPAARLERFQEKLQTFPVRKRDKTNDLERFGVSLKR
ncbi:MULTISPECIES: hypothetical protein [unclassified Devosia]|uniref:hypothetical protein n=1 Tax=unclassified Devosia TaxID=196773 RepID=UPI000ADD7FF4|nr:MULTISPECIES: hypothetical protein [unclassified Devosia]